MPKMLEIAYETMIKHYNLNNEGAKKDHWLRPREKMAEIYGTIFEDLTDTLFMEGENVVSALEN